MINTKYGSKYISTHYNESLILDAQANTFFRNFAKDYLLGEIKKTLTTLGVSHDI
jgi:hypothetical protein